MSKSRDIIFYQEDASLDQWCSLRVIKYNYRAESITSKERVLCDIQLPLPLQLNTGYNQQWTELDDVSAFIANAISGKGNRDAIQKAIDSGDFTSLQTAARDTFSSVSANRGALATNLALNPAVTGAAVGIVANSPAVAAVTAATVKAISSVAGLASNKYQTVTFEKPQLRQHQFSWNLVARDANQASRIQKIINKLKLHSSPSQTNNFGYFEYPELFALHFGDGGSEASASDAAQQTESQVDSFSAGRGVIGNPNLFSISPSAMSSFTVDYHATGRPLYSYDDKQPLSVTINIVLQEVVVVTKQTINKYNR